MRRDELPHIGEVIELVRMPEDPDAMEPGTRGTVSRVSGPHSLGGPEFWQISVVWENHRTLMLTIPPDEYRVVRPDPGP